MKPINAKKINNKAEVYVGLKVLKTYDTIQNS